MKALAAFSLGAFLTLNSLLGGSGSLLPRCQYIVETPTSGEAYWGLEDAQEALVALGVDPANTPFGYDIVSRPGC